MSTDIQSSSTDSKPPSEYTPRACLAILGSFTGLFCSVGFLNSFAVFEEHYGQNELAGKSQSTIAWIGAIAIFFIFFISVVSGQLLDVIGPNWLLYTGSVGAVFAIMMTSLCKEFYQFILAQGVLLGISLALLVCPMLGLVGKYIKKNRGAAMGIVMAGSSLGGVIWPIAINELIQKPNVGFAWTMRIVGFMMIPLLAISCLCCRPAPAAPSEQSNTSTDSETAKEEPKEIPKADYSILKTASLQLTSLAFFIIYFGMFSPFFFTTSYAISKGFTSSLAFYTTSIINGASLFGRILPGILADKYGRFNCCIIFTFFSGLVALCWTKATSVAGLVIFSAAYGFVSGAIISLQQACAAQIATPQNLGLTIGVVMASTSLSAMAGIPISGELAGKYGFLALSIYSGVSQIVGSLLLLGARLTQTREMFVVV